jgi:serine phosphatase RsbU (regulator of sigma subunit)
VQENAEELKPGPLTFRLRILLTLMGVIVPMVGILLFVLERETSVQIEVAIHEAVGNSRSNLLELEQSWKTELAAISGRYARSSRILGAFDAAVEDGNPAVLAEAADYETKLTGFSGHLFLFFDLEGQVLCTLSDGQVRVQKNTGSVPVWSIPRYEESFGYGLWGGQLYAAHTAALNLFSRKIGYMLVGFPLREDIVQHLGKRVDGQVCFVVGSSAVVATPGVARSALLAPMEAAAGLKVSRVLPLSGQTWALFSELLNPQEPGEGSMVCAIALDDALAPFRRIRTILVLTAVASVVAAVVMGFFLAKGLSIPILELVKGTAKVARGDYDFRINVTSRDEVGLLANAFNSMVRGLLLKEKMERDLAVAREIQMSSLPKQMPTLAGYEFEAWSQPADEAGGDIYDALDLSAQRVGILMADATGHGIGPAISVSQLRAMFRMGLLLGTDLTELMSKINLQLTSDLPAGRFITAFAGILDGNDHQIRYISGGQAPLIHYRAEEDRLDWLDASTVPMGLLAWPPLIFPPAVEMRPGDIFALVSDGIFEYADRTGEPFGKERVGDLIRSHRHDTLEELRKKLCEAVRVFSGGLPQEDDMTVVLVRRDVHSAAA